MPANQFRKLSKFLSIVSKLIAIFILSVLVFGSFTLFIRQKLTAFTLDKMDIFSFVFSDATITQDDYNWANAIVLPMSLSFLGYIFFKASYLFDYLAEGKTPFTQQFTQSVRIMGFILIIYDLVTSVLYMFFINFAADEGMFIYLSLSVYFFVGLIIYLMSGILNYGINLQEQVDEKKS